MAESHNFKVKDYWSDLQGTPYQENSDWIGMIVQKQ
jgi:hypothetical protein